KFDADFYSFLDRIDREAKSYSPAVRALHVLHQFLHHSEIWPLLEIGPQEEEHIKKEVKQFGNWYLKALKVYLKEPQVNEQLTTELHDFFLFIFARIQSWLFERKKEIRSRRKSNSASSEEKPFDEELRDMLKEIDQEYKRLLGKVDPKKLARVKSIPKAAVAANSQQTPSATRISLLIESLLAGRPVTTDGKEIVRKADYEIAFQDLKEYLTKGKFVDDDGVVEEKKADLAQSLEKKEKELIFDSERIEQLVSRVITFDFSFGRKVTNELARRRVDKDFADEILELMAKRFIFHTSRPYAQQLVVLMLRAVTHQSNLSWDLFSHICEGLYHYVSEHVSRVMEAETFNGSLLLPVFRILELYVGNLKQRGEQGKAMLQEKGQAIFDTHQKMLEMLKLILAHAGDKDTLRSRSEFEAIERSFRAQMEVLQKEGFVKMGTPVLTNQALPPSAPDQVESVRLTEEAIQRLLQPDHPYGEVAGLAQQAIALDPKNVSGWTLLAVAARARGQVRSSQLALYQALNIMAYGYQAKKNLVDHALPTLEILNLDKFPFMAEDFRSFLLLASALRWLNQSNEARAILDIADKHFAKDNQKLGAIEQERALLFGTEGEIGVDEVKADDDQTIAQRLKSVNPEALWGLNTREAAHVLNLPSRKLGTYFREFPKEQMRYGIVRYKSHGHKSGGQDDGLPDSLTVGSKRNQAIAVGLSQSKDVVGIIKRAPKEGKVKQAPTSREADDEHLKQQKILSPEEQEELSAYHVLADLTNPGFVRELQSKGFLYVSRGKLEPGTVLGRIEEGQMPAPPSLMGEARRIARESVAQVLQGFEKKVGDAGHFREAFSKKIGKTL
ncbi:MAG: hypothetical protein HY582_04820, partial [Candidatus Omnitrophica bacterium]|nr:hypothetical protein [Candidatus Omnitrophota bacterium]